MSRKEIFDVIYKNRILILCCTVLIFGGIIGTSVLRILPENICTNLFNLSNTESKNFANEFLNRFCFPMIILTVIFFSGFGILGRFTALFALFLNGAFFTFENGIKYMFSGAEYFTECMVRYFTASLFFGFILIIMAENAFYSSNLIKIIINNKNAEKPHFKAKNLTVKFISFTAVIAAFSAFSAYISVILQKIL